MKKKTVYVGGFVATNQGTIKDCYSLVKLSSKEFTAGGFVGENNGSIKSSFCRTPIKNLAGGFTGSGQSPDDDCIFIYKEDKEDGKVKNFWDKEYGLDRNKLRDENDARKCGLILDDNSIFRLNSGYSPLKFKEDKWIENTSKYFEEAEEDEVFLIKTADDLKKFAWQVNNGNIVAREGIVKLTDDIDLGGKEWLPIGATLKNSFNGVFDGAGHIIKNFIIRSDDVTNKGFFGFLTGKVFNLTVDLHIEGNGTIGGLVAQNQNGTIGCCAAIVSIDASSKSEHLAVGGLVGVNAGDIYSSYAAGHEKFPIIIILPFLMAGGMIAAIVAITYVVTKIYIPATKTTPIYQKIPSAAQQTKIEDEEGGGKVQMRTDSNFVSFQFNKLIDVNIDEGICTLEYKNPGESNHNTVVELQICDEVAYRALGGTGRSAEEQAKLEADPDYDPKLSFVTIASCDAVSPGYMVRALALNELAIYNLAPGSYEGVIMIYPYDVKTNSKAMLESQLPVDIIVH